MHSCTPERLFNVENVKPQMPLRFERASDEEPEIQCECGTRLKLGRLPWQSRLPKMQAALEGQARLEVPH